MAHALNLTLKLKQDAATKQKLAAFAQSFASDVQPVIDAALRESGFVHFARIVVIDGQYVQVLTEYDGDKGEYAEFFRQKLTKIFAFVFSMADDAPPNIDSLINDKQAFFEYSMKKNVPCVGVAKVNENDGTKAEDGYLFSAYGFDTVKDNLAKKG